LGAPAKPACDGGARWRSFLSWTIATSEEFGGAPSAGL